MYRQGKKNIQLIIFRAIRIFCCDLIHFAWMSESMRRLPIHPDLSSSQFNRYELAVFIQLYIIN